MGFSFGPNPVSGVEADIAKGVAERQAQAKQSAYGQMIRPTFDPGQYTGFDSSSLGSSLKRAQARNASGNRQQAMAGLQKAGIRGADTSRALGNIAAQQNQGENMIDAQLGRMDWQDRYNQWQSYNDNAYRQIGLNEALEAAQRKQYQDYQDAQPDVMGDLLNLGGQMAGAYMPTFLNGSGSEKKKKK